MICAFLLAAASFDAQAAYDHARGLAALGPHPWGSTRNAAAAEYIASQFRAIGLEEVRLQRFERQRILGANVIGVLRAADPRYVLIGAHHDTVPGSPGAYDDGAGVGVLIETARVLRQRSNRPRTLVFVSFDGEEAWAVRNTTTAGSRAFVAALGPKKNDLVAAVIIEMCGQARGSPCLHAIAYADPLRPGRSRIAPGWLIDDALKGAHANDARLFLGDRWLFWLYQPAVRFWRVQLYGDDISFVQAGLPAVFLSDSSITSFYPWYHQSADTADKLDVTALHKMGAAVLGAAMKLMTTPGGPAIDPTWYATPIETVGSRVLTTMALLTLIPGLLLSLRRGGIALVFFALQAAIFLLLYWRHPVSTLWLLALPNLVFPLVRTFSMMLIPLAPALALMAVGVYAWSRGGVTGLFWAPWEWLLLLAAFALAWLAPRPGKKGGKRGRRERRRGLPK